MGKVNGTTKGFANRAMSRVQSPQGSRAKFRDRLSGLASALEEPRFGGSPRGVHRGRRGEQRSARRDRRGGIFGADTGYGWRSAGPTCGARGLAMTRKKPAGRVKKATTVVANHPDDLKGTLKLIGGSRSDRWNNVLAYQAVETLWLKNSDKERRDEQYGATVAGLIGIGPRDELEGMTAAQLLAAHNAAMEFDR